MASGCVGCENGTTSFRAPCGARYCSRECQVRHWPAHKLLCDHHWEGLYTKERMCLEAAEVQEIRALHQQYTPGLFLSDECMNCLQRVVGRRFKCLCRGAMYCGRTCQKEHWSVHRPVCLARLPAPVVAWPSRRFLWNDSKARQEGRAVCLLSQTCRPSIPACPVDMVRLFYNTVNLEGDSVVKMADAGSNPGDLSRNLKKKYLHSPGSFFSPL